MPKRMLVVLLLLGLTVTPMAGAQVNTPLDCLIEPSVTVSVGSPIDGVLESVVVDRGDLVAKGTTEIDVAPLRPERFSTS